MQCKYYIFIINTLFRSKKNRDDDRDVSEKIALGLPNAGASSETMYDARLFDGEGVSYFFEIL